jgi:excisionase family DNA binding protein
MSALAELQSKYTEPELCSKLGVSRVTIWRWRSAGKIGFCRFGGKVVYLERHVVDFLNRCERKADNC